MHACRYALVIWCVVATRCMYVCWCVCMQVFVCVHACMRACMHVWWPGMDAEIEEVVRNCSS